MNPINYKEDFIFISYYTNDGKYPLLAEKLIDSLKRFDLSFDVQVKLPFGSWEDGITYKSQYILERLLHYRKAVIWLDIDTEIWQFPELLFGKHDFAIYNWIADNNHHLSGEIEFDINTKKLICSGGVQKYGYTAAAIELLMRWIYSINETNIKSGDDPILDFAFNKFSPPVKPLWLPKTYNRMDKNTYHWSSLDSSSIVINHDYTVGGHRSFKP